MTIINNCPACRDYDVFGIDKKGCCYLYNDFCYNIEDCIIKQIVSKCNEHTKPIRQWTEKGTCVSMKNGKLVAEEQDIICAEYDKDKMLANEILEMLKLSY